MAEPTPDLFTPMFLFVLGVALVVLPFSVRFRRWRGEKFARRNLAYVDGSLVPEFDRGLNLGNQIAGIGFAGAALLWFLVSAMTTLDPHWLWVGWGLFLIAETVVVAIHLSHRVTTGPTLGQPRFARSRAVEISDYFPRSMRLTAIAAGGLSLIFAISAFALGATRWFDGSRILTAPGPWLCLVCFAALAAVEFAARRMAEIPEPAVDPAHLYWQDALRSGSLQGLYTGVIPSVLFGWSDVATTLGSAATFSVPGWVIPTSLIVALVLAMATFLVAIQFATREAYVDGLWFRRRLWPMLEPGEVLRPGQTIQPTVSKGGHA